MDCRMGHAYNEEAFRYLLGVHQRRAERSNRPFLLLLIDMKPERGLPAHIPPAVARKLFVGLWRALREADVIGWYRQELIAGAVLTELPRGTALEATRAVEERVAAALSVDLPAAIGRQIQVRVCQIQPRLTS